MQLKVKFLKLSAGRPVAILSRRFAEDKSIHVDDRILIRKNKKTIVAVVDTAKGFLKKNEIALSTEITNFINLKQGEIINIEPALKPESIEFINKKLSCKPLDKDEIRGIIQDIANNKITEPEIAYFISAVYKCGMNMREIAEMTKIMAETGEQLNFKGVVADKHSIGGVPGRTTPIVVSICAAAGLTVPNTSSRAITSSSGTADSMEVICQVSFSIKEINQIIKKTNACLVWGGALGLAPVDDKLIQIEKLLSLDPPSQLLASIMAKKLAVHVKYNLIEIPYGKNAKVSYKEAKELEKKFLELGKRFHIHLECLLSEAKEPICNAMGPALEIKEVIQVLKQESPCYKLQEKSLELAGKLLEIAGKAQKGKGIKLAKEILESGKALCKFLEIIRAQKGKINGIKDAKFHQDIFALKNGKIKEINIKEMTSLARLLGCPADKLAGIYIYKHLNQSIKKGEKIMTLYAESKSELYGGIKFYKNNNPFKLK